MSEESLTFSVSPEDAGKRLDAFLAEKIDRSRSRLQKMIDGGDVLVNENPAKVSLKLDRKSVV